MFMAADIVVKAVMVGLAFASVLTWTIWLAKAIELLAARRRLRAALARSTGARRWPRRRSALRDRRRGRRAGRPADAELRLSAGALAPDGVKERVASRLERIEAAGRRAA